MKTSSLIVTTLAALAAVDGAECNISSLVTKLLPLLFNSNLSQCVNDSGYTIFPYSGLPDATQAGAICESSACVALLEAAQDLELPDCTVTYDGTAYNIKDSLAAIVSTCSD